MLVWKPKVSTVSTRVIMLYNAVQILLSAYVVSGTAKYMFSGALDIESERASLWPYFFAHYINKYVDFIDTWIILKKGDYRRLSLLHIFHHGTVGILWYVYLTAPYQVNGMCIGASVNSFIHILMYGYYTAAAAKIKVPQAIKFLVTKLQILQFIFFMYNIYSNSVGNVLDIVTLVYTAILLLLFVNFYVQNNGVAVAKALSLSLPIPLEVKN